MTDTGEIIITFESEDHRFSYEQFGLTFESTDEEVIQAIAPQMKELDESFDLEQEWEEGNWTVRRAENSQTVFIFPKSTQG